MEDPLTASEDTNEHQHDSSQQDEDGKEDPNPKKPNVRKRTKTGCLIVRQACRRRRIKCDEGRPTCNNCIKSKRQCEGYSQRVIFKDPMGSMQGGPFGPALYPHGSSHFAGQLQAKSSSQGPLPMIAPKPPSYDYQGHQNLHMGHYGQGQPSMSPTGYNFNQSPINHAHYPQPNVLVSPQAQPGYVKTDHNPHQHHFALAPNGQGSSNAYAKAPPPATAEAPSEVSREVVGTQVQTWDYELPDDDASMGESDDETRDPRDFLGPVVQRFNGTWDANGTRVRNFSTFAQCDVLSEYTASAQIRELRDPQILAIFMHFIKVTGPSMSLYERHPFDHGEDDQFIGPNHKEADNLWSYTFPLISFNHPALLHAMLALASLQIAKLQRVPATAAMRHYHLAIRRIAKNVRAPLRRTQPPTLAATLLLAYFEVWSSDHTKWCNHLFGARILFREIPLKEMTRQCLLAKLRKQKEKDAEEQDQINSFFPGFVTNGRSQLMELDYGLLSTIAGQQVIPEQYGLGDDQPFNLATNYTTDRDIEQYENLRDLYWWYCKMDVYQSILGGTKLFMEYEVWTQCPPRAPISKLEAIYGTYDHLMLLLGRLANFSSKDLSRKRRANRGKTAPQGSGSPPPFPGMLPTHGKVKVPMGFSPPARDTTPQSDSNEDIDPEVSFQAALQDWDEIRQGFEAFEHHLGPEFQPLRPEYSDRRESPFGMTLQYRTFSVAGIWMNYYMGMIHLFRTHPSMPPAAMQAAGLSARKTAGYAIQLGRIAAGLSDDCSQMAEIGTMVSAAFIESCFCLFVAGVQYQEDAQRHWLVRRMYDISRLTGWQSAKQIADGCESGWIKAAQLGRGPPYVRAPDIGAEVPISVWQNPRRIDRIIQEHDGTGDDKRLVLAKSERAYYALGLIGVEHDLEVLELKDDG
ncbi:Fc.00g089280.m01.CDS01 [Cosmosporella sp. VM-42]